MTKPLFLKLLISIILACLGQISMKYGMMAHKARYGELNGVGDLLHAMTQPAVLVGLGCFVLSSMLYLVLMTKMPLSILYPMVALNYVFVTFLSYVVFGDKPNLLRVVGLAVIILGVVIVSKSAPAEASPVETPVPVQQR